MNILHINSEYASKVFFRNLLVSLSQKNIGNVNYSLIKNSAQHGSNIGNIENVDFHYSRILRKYHRIFYFNKLRYVVNDIKQKINLNEITLLHAYKLFNDGGIAYKLYEEFNIPYIVTIRETDIMKVLKYLRFLKPYGAKILINAKRIVLITPSYKYKIKQEYPKIYNQIKSKIICIPNGVDDFWHQKSNHVKKVFDTGDVFKVVFTGDFSNKKNIIRLIKATEYINKNSKYSMSLSIIGNKGINYKKVLKKCKNNTRIEFLGRLNFNQIIEVYKDMHAFAMPSLYETFGLVYIEALLQGLPIIYTEGQGVDGYFDDYNIGLTVNAEDILDIAEKLIYMIENYDQFRIPFDYIHKSFNWDYVASKYYNIYKEVTNGLF